jgi:type III restriction enzyme
MAIHKDFPTSPYEIINPEVRWFPADESLRETTLEKLLPPLVPELRRQVAEWRESGYEGASETSRTLLNWWFNTDHPVRHADGTTTNFKYYFAQQESLETVVYLHEKVKVADKHDLLRFDTNGVLSAGMMDETWRRYVLKMATGTGKTKVMSLLLAWAYFHKTYEENSDLAKNFLLIAPNIIVLDRLRTDFDGLKIFNRDPVIPENGTAGRNWKTDFQLTLHIQDQVGTFNPSGNIFLTNIHRVYENRQTAPTADDDDTTNFFLGSRPTGATTGNKVDLGDIVRSIDEIVVINDEAHHIHDPRMAWFKSIKDIHNRLLQKGGKLALQIDVTATPKDQRGAIFAQTVADYPLVEAITQNVVKHPVLPDQASRAKLEEKQSSVYTQRYGDYIHLGVEEWKKSFSEHEKLGKKAVLFVMTDETKNCDDVAGHLEKTYPELQNAVLTIHTNKTGDISEATAGKKKDELEFLRARANDIDSLKSPYKAIVSVLMLKEGWDVRNVSTIIGLRAYTAKANILPEQTLGRGLRRMYPSNNVEEYVSVVGTDAFMDFVESINSEGVELEKREMGTGTKPVAPLIVEVDQQDNTKDLDELDIEIPVLSPRTYREYKKLSDLNLNDFKFKPVEYKKFSDEEQREIVFRDITTRKISHVTRLDTAIALNYRSVIGYFAQTILRDLRLFAAYDLLYPKIKDFVEHRLFGRVVKLEDPNTLRNLSEPEVTNTIIGSFKTAINELTISDSGDAEIRDRIKLRNMRPFVVKDQTHLRSKKSVFNKTVGDSILELRFAQFLERCDDVISYGKNYFQINFKLEYVNATGGISNYYPDFFVKTSPKSIFIIETKGLEDLDDPPKVERLRQWCEDVNSAQSEVEFDFVYVKQEKFDALTVETTGSSKRLTNFASLVERFQEYKG